jgi:hypothetical protein
MHSRGRSEGTIFAPLRADDVEVIPMRKLSPSISRLGLRLCTLAALLLVWDTPASALPVTYEETGRLFTSFVAPYDGTMELDGTVTFPTPLPDNLKLQDFATGFGTGGGSYSFSDGVTNYTLSNSTLGDLQLSTDQNGNVVAWQVEIFSNAGPMVLSQNLPSVPGSSFDKVLSSSAQQVALSDGPATWTVVPEPALSALALTGLSILALVMRRGRT